MMNTELIVLFVLLTIVAEILGTIGGFGSSVFFVPIAGFFLDFYSVLGITVLFHLLSNLVKIVFFRKGIDWRIVWLIGIPSVLFVILGAWLSARMETDILKLVLAIFLITMSLFFLLMKKFELNPTNLNAITGGGLSGLIAGIVGTGGALRGLTMAAFNLQKEVFVATSAIIDLMVDTGRSLIYIRNGFVHKDDLYLIPFLFAAAIAGTWIGKKLMTKIRQENFRSVVLIFILCIGVVSLVEFFRSQD